MNDSLPSAGDGRANFIVITMKRTLLAEKSKTNKTKHILTGYIFGINQKHFLYVEPQGYPRK